jgi:hypothetical protein
MHLSGYCCRFNGAYPKTSATSRPAVRLFIWKESYVLVSKGFGSTAKGLSYCDTITVADAERCTCISCKNFAAQRTNVFPEEFLRFLKELGVDPSREWGILDYDFGPEDPHIHLYGGWFLFCGELVEGSDRQTELGAGTFAHWFTNSFPDSTLPKELKLCAVEFLVRIPWILPEKSE